MNLRNDGHSQFLNNELGFSTKADSFIVATLASLVLCMAASTAFAEPIGSAVRIVNKVTGAIDQRE